MEHRLVGYCLELVFHVFEHAKLRALKFVGLRLEGVEQGFEKQRLHIIVDHLVDKFPVINLVRTVFGEMTYHHI